MLCKQYLCAALLLACLLPLGIDATAAEVASDSVYCFQTEDFSADALRGICITGLPDSDTGTLRLGQRVVRPGDILTAQQLATLTFHPLRSDTDMDAAVTYLPIYDHQVAAETTFHLCIRGREDKAPVAENSALETYKNLPNSGRLKARDPEGEEMTYTLIRAPKRGDVIISPDGSFTYTPKKNKVGTDSFVYTATDPAGNVSREATVTIEILKPGDRPTYGDMTRHEDQFAAEWLKNTGIFEGETIGEALYFAPEQTVSRGEFVAMLVQSLQLPVDDSATVTGFTDEVPTWLKPYLAAALRSGLTAGWQGSVFGAAQPIAGAEAALLLQNALALPVTTLAATTDRTELALAVVAENGISLTADRPLTRAEVARTLYQVSKMDTIAPGLQVLARQK